MSYVTEHNTEEKRKCDDRKVRWIYFSVSRDSIRVDDGLEWRSEFSFLEFRWWIDCEIRDAMQLRGLHIISLL